MNMHYICCVRIASGFLAYRQSTELMGKETSYAVFKCILSGTLIKGAEERSISGRKKPRTI